MSIEVNAPVNKGLRFVSTYGLYDTINGGLSGHEDNSILTECYTTCDVSFHIDDYKTRVTADNYVALRDPSFIDSLHTVHEISFNDQVDPAKENISRVIELLPKGSPEDNIFTVYINRLIKYVFKEQIILESFVNDIWTLVDYMDKKDVSASSNIVCSAGQMLKDFLNLNKDAHMNLVTSGEYIIHKVRLPVWLWALNGFVKSDCTVDQPDLTKQLMEYGNATLVNKNKGPYWLYEFLLSILKPEVLYRENTSMQCYANFSICLNKQPYFMVMPRTVFLHIDENSEYNFTLVELPSIWGI